MFSRSCRDLSDALNKVNAVVRSWRLHHRTAGPLLTFHGRSTLSCEGWMNYYGAFYRSALYRLLTPSMPICCVGFAASIDVAGTQEGARPHGIRGHPRSPFFAHWAWVNTLPAVW